MRLREVGKQMERCSWANHHDLMKQYHDEEWGIPHYEDRYLFELLCLEGAQSGLSWQIVLSKREEYRKAFHSFDIAYCASLSDQDMLHIKDHYQVIKHLGKIKSVVINAKCVLKIQEEYGSFSNYIWGYIEKPIVNRFRELSEIPSKTLLSEQISKELKKKGFSFVGPVTTYSFMQAIGMVNDHVITCFRHREHIN